jgi:hypothetical protein
MSLRLGPQTPFFLIATIITRAMFDSEAAGLTYSGFFAIKFLRRNIQVRFKWCGALQD